MTRMCSAIAFRTSSLARRGLRRLCSRREWQCHHKARAYAYNTFGMNHAAMRFDDLLDDGQPQAQTAAALTRLVHLVEPLENAAEVLGRDAAAAVADGHFDSTQPALAL